jgi:hypothetical protein
MADLAKFEERLEKLEQLHSTGASDTVRETQLELLEALYALRDSLTSELPQQVTQEVSKELDALRDENQRLKYRVEHLKKHILSPA